MEQEIKQLEKEISSFGQELGRIEGQYSLLNKQVEASKKRVTTLEEQRKIDLKAIEVLNLVSKSTRDVVKNTFESLVSYALKAVYQEDYKFFLEFGNRGNLGELNFLLKSPENKEPLPLEDCQAGGSLDIVSLALRFVLLQVFRPTFEGPIILDESTKMLSKNYAQNEYNLYEFMAKKFNRQLIIITHNEKVVELAANKIEITK
jgi:DNA repair exonuclease SbcCD ATPase subunit